MSYAAAFPPQLRRQELPAEASPAAAGPKIGDTLRTLCGACGAHTTCVMELVVTTPPIEVLPLCDYCSSGPTPWP